MNLSHRRVSALVVGSRIVLPNGQIAEITHIKIKGLSREITTESGTVTLLRTATVQIATGETNRRGRMK